MTLYRLAPASLALLLVSGAASTLSANVISASSCLPPSKSAYNATSTMVWTAGPNTFALSNAALSGFSACSQPPANVNSSSSEHFSAVLDGAFAINGNGTPAHGFATVNILLQKTSGPNGSALGAYSTQMTQLDITGLPGGAQIRIDPVTPSTGSTTVSDAGGGNFSISSFFDVFTDLSLDAGQTWIPSTGGTITNLNPAPEPASFLLIAGGLAIGCVRKFKR